MALSDVPTLEELAEVTGQDIEQLRRDREAFLEVHGSEAGVEPAGRGSDDE